MLRKFGFLSLLAIIIVQAFGLQQVLRHDDMGVPGDLQVNEHHDLRELVRGLREERAPAWKWFVSDWPLHNGFYRPIPTLSVAFDDSLFGNDLNKYKIQNWVIALACSFGLLWFVWELFRLPWLALGSSVLFAAWQSGVENWLPIEWLALAIAVVIAIYGIVFGRPSRFAWVLVAGAIAYLGREFALVLQAADIGGRTFDYRTIAWPVGRTATLMTFFALISLAAYCRFERNRCNWASLGALLALALAFCSYEQAVVIPALHLACAIALRVQGVAVRWAWHIFPWAILALYASLHLTYLQVDSKYRMQAARGYFGGIRDIVVWLFPSYFGFRFINQVFDPNISIAVFALERYWKALADVAANIFGLVVARKKWVYTGFGLLAAVGSYAPMAFQHPFSHYFHLPLAMRAIFVASLSWICFEWLRELVKKKQLAS